MRRVAHRASRIAVIGVTCLLLHGCGTAGARDRDTLVVCADPNNLPFSNERREGFENRIIELVARDLGRRVSYEWWAQRRGFFRNTLNSKLCDIVPGMAASVEFAWATEPYYRSTYVFVSRSDRHLQVRSFDDPALRDLRIGVQIIGEDYSNTPPVTALARRGLSAQLSGYRVAGDYSQPNPPARIIDAVVNGDVDVAVVWGPLAGYFAQRANDSLTITPVEPQIDTPFLPFVFDIAMAVRRADTTLHAMIDSTLSRRRADIDAILREYNIPRLDVERVQ
jgi:mxaJ protein